MKLLVYIIGPAGSGKSTFTASFRDWLQSHNVPTATVNLDPAVENLDYVPDVDVREYVFVRDVLEEYGLGPNGAIIAATDLSLEHLPKISKSIDEEAEGYVLIDTPGQMEVFTFRQSGGIMVNTLCSKDRACAVAFLLDASLSIDPYNLVSQIFLAASAFYRFKLPLIVLLNKMDLLSDSEKEKILNWLAHPETLEFEISKVPRDYDAHFTGSVVRVLTEFLSIIPVVMVSAKKSENFEEVYFYLQQIYMGGEDFETPQSE
ncbi:MAG: ATP/GTP-binding protein [Infirmifilum sp.]|jgi:GTPase SAR1 family protein|uniref:PRK13768 family protein n=1 Tax=Infirmifilum TaxID=2856573 RepID=UPI0023521579